MNDLRKPLPRTSAVVARITFDTALLQEPAPDHNTRQRDLEAAFADTVDLGPEEAAS